MEQDNDVTLPRATVIKMVKDFLPGDMRCASDSVEMLMECCTEFIQMVSSHANELATKDKKATIMPEHVLRTVEDMGFAEFKGEVKASWDAFKDDQRKEPKLANRKTKAEMEGMTEAEQIAMQQAMFAAARMRSQTLDAAAAAAVTAAYGEGAQDATEDP